MVCIFRLAVQAFTFSTYAAVDSNIFDKSPPCLPASIISTVALLITGRSILLLNSIIASLKVIPQLMWATSTFNSSVRGPYIRLAAYSSDTCSGMPVFDAVARSRRNSGAALSILFFHRVCIKLATLAGTTMMVMVSTVEK